MNSQDLGDDRGPRYRTTPSVAQGAHKEATGNVGAVRISCLSANKASWERWHQRQPGGVFHQPQTKHQQKRTIRH